MTLPKTIHLVTAFVAIFISQLRTTLSFTPAVQIVRVPSSSFRAIRYKHVCYPQRNIFHLTMSKQDDMFQDQEEGEKVDMNTDDVEFVSMQDGDEISDEFLKNMQGSAPGQLEIMKQVRIFLIDSVRS